MRDRFFRICAATLGGWLVIYYALVVMPSGIAGNGRHYGDLASAFLAGQTYRIEPPPTEITRLKNPRAEARAKIYDAVTTGNHLDQDIAIYQSNDYLLYKDQFYIFYGPVPAILLFVPFRYLTGEDLSARFAALILTLAGTALTVFLFCILARRLGIENHTHQLFLAIVLAVGTFIPYQLRQADHYQVAMGSAYMFTALAFIALTKAFDRPGGKPGWLALASVCFGLSTGSRLNFGLSGVLLAFIGLAIGHTTGWKWDRTLWKRGSAIALPFSICIAGLGWYNYIRFGSPFDVGLSYQIVGNVIPPLGFENTLLNAYLTYLHPIPLNWNFPFFHPHRCCPIPMTLPWWTLSPVSPTQEPSYGAFVNAPFLWMLVFLPGLCLSSRTIPERTWVLKALFVFSLLVPVPALISVTTLRYLVDFVPWLMVLAGLSYLYALKRYAGQKKILRFIRIAAILTGGYTIACGMVIGFIGYFG
jgi:hypothetical protein